MASQTTRLQHMLKCAGPQARLVYVKFTPNGTSAPTVDECHGCSSNVTRSGAGVYVVSLGVNALKAATVVGCNVQSSGTTNNKLQWAVSVANKTVTITHTVNPTSVVVGPVRIPDVSTTSSTGYSVAPVAGSVSKIYSVLGGAITVADATVTSNIAGTPITNGALTIAYTSSAAGDVDSATPTAANTVTAGQAMTFVSDGGSTDAQTLDIFYQIDSVGVASDTAGQIELAVLCHEAS